VHQLFAGKHRQPLTRIEDKGDAALRELGRVLHHALLAVRRNDADGDVGRLLHPVLMGKTHGAGMEGGDLVVVHVGGDKGLGRVGSVDLPDMAAIYAAAVHPGGIGVEILADRAHGQGIAAQQMEVVSDVAGTAAEFAAHLGHQETDV